VQHSSGVQVVKSQQDLLDVILHLNIPKLFPVPADMKECFRRAEFHQNMNIGAILKVPQELHHMPVVQLPVQCDLLLHLLLGTPLLLEHSLLYHLVRKQLPCPAVRHRVDLGKPPCA